MVLGGARNGGAAFAKRRGLGKLWFMPKLNVTQTKAALKTVPEWKRKGGTISRLFCFKDFVGSVRFVNAVARLAEKARHHPDIDIRWNKVMLTLTTHDAGGLTRKDFMLARRFDHLS
jgi:4a-hydroxytetrahydrobiopterin dehydratase